MAQVGQRVGSPYMVPMKSRTKSGKRFSRILARTAPISCNYGVEVSVSAACPEAPAPTLPRPPKPQAHLVGDVVNSEVVQGGSVVAME